MSAKSVLNQFKSQAQAIIADGTQGLEESYDGGDWMLLVVNRGYLDALTLSSGQKAELASLDLQLSRVFTDELLNKFSLMDTGVKMWWG